MNSLKEEFKKTEDYMILFEIFHFKLTISYSFFRWIFENSERP